MRKAIVGLVVGFVAATIAQSGFAAPFESEEERVQEEDVIIKLDGPGKKGKGESGKRRIVKRIVSGPGEGPFLGRYKLVWQSLDLTDVQREKLFELQQKFQREAFEAHQLKERVQFDLQTRLKAESLDEGALSQSAEQAADAERKFVQAKIDFVKEMRGILKPDQLKKLHEHLRSLAQDFEGRQRFKRQKLED